VTLLSPFSDPHLLMLPSRWLPGDTGW
jgi:hypothetical protein